MSSFQRSLDFRCLDTEQSTYIVKKEFIRQYFKKIYNNGYDVCSILNLQTVRVDCLIWEGDVIVIIFLQTT